MNPFLTHIDLFQRIGADFELYLTLNSRNGWHLKGRPIDRVDSQVIKQLMVRLKTRYLVVEAAAARKLEIKREDIAALIRDSIEKSYGDYGRGLSQYAFQVVYYNEHTRLAVVRCARELCKMVESSLVFVTELHSQDLKIRVAHVCGSSRTCRQHLLSFSMERVKAQNLEAANPTLLAELQEGIAAIDTQ